MTHLSWIAPDWPHCVLFGSLHERHPWGFRKGTYYIHLSPLSDVLMGSLNLASYLSLRDFYFTNWSLIRNDKNKVIIKLVYIRKDKTNINWVTDWRKKNGLILKCLLKLSLCFPRVFLNSLLSRWVLSCMFGLHVYNFTHSPYITEVSVLLQSQCKLSMCS